jgi:hypothetical protein
MLGRFNDELPRFYVSNSRGDFTKSFRVLTVSDGSIGIALHHASVPLAPWGVLGGVRKSL